MWQVKIASLVMEEKNIATLYAYDANGNLRKKKVIETDREGTPKYRAELGIILAALKEVRFPCRIVLSPAQITIRNAIQHGWAAGWKEHGWMNRKGKQPRDPDLWEQILEELEKHTEVKAE